MLKAGIGRFGIGGSYDQHFLIDPRVIGRITDYADICDDVVLEIGAGNGNLTKALAAKAAKVIAIESSGRLAAVISDLKLPNVDIIHGDALKVNFPEFDKVVSNLPYSISSNITFKLLRYDFQLGILMYQYEFAKRMVATHTTRDYSRLSICVQYFADVEILENVPKTAFHPRPEVKSAIVKIIPRPPTLNVLNKDFFFDFVTAVFTQRRKQMKNAIINMLQTKSRTVNGLHCDAREVVNILPRNMMCKRPGELSPEELATLSNMIYEAISYGEEKEDITA